MKIKELKDMRTIDMYNFLVEERNNLLEDIKEINSKFPKKQGLFDFSKEKVIVIENPKSIYLKKLNGWVEIIKLLGDWCLFDRSLATYKNGLEDLISRVNKRYFTSDVGIDWCFYSRNSIINFIVNNNLVEDITKGYLDDKIVEMVKNSV